MSNYEKEIWDSDGKHKQERMRHACDSIACLPIDIPGTELRLPHFKCVLGECELCRKFKAPDLELQSDRTISYSLFQDHVRCSVHGPDHIQVYNEAQKDGARCARPCPTLRENASKKEKGT